MTERHPDLGDPEATYVAMESLRRSQQDVGITEENLAELENQPWDSLDDVPLDAWFRHKLAPRGNKRRISSFNDKWNEVEINDCSFAVGAMVKYWEWSRTPKDENSWHACNKMFTAANV